MRTFPLTSLLLASLLGLLAACTPFQRLHTGEQLRDSVNGSWTVLHDGQKKLEAMTPPATLVFDAGKNQISGFDGCNRFSGSYVMEQDMLKATVASTRMACKDETANHVSQTLQSLLQAGAEVTSIDFMGARGLLLKNKAKGLELRLGNSQQLAKP